MKKILTYTSSVIFAFLPQLLLADELVLDNQIVQGSSCIGAGCQDGMDFGENTLILKDDVIQIRFQDTSSTSSFPTRDWQDLTQVPFRVRTARLAPVTD